MKNKLAARPGDYGPVVVDLQDRVSGMSDSALSTLHANAVRLAQSGSERQRASADALLPAIEAELTARHTKSLAASPRARREIAKLSERFNVALAAAKMSAAAPEREAVGPAHKFGMGDLVKLHRTMQGSAIDGFIYEIVRQLPPERNEFQYRIRTKDGRVERVVTETQLSASRLSVA